MKQFKKTPITKERLFSIGFEEYKGYFIFKIDKENYIQIINKNVSIVDDKELYNVIELDREFKTMEDIKQLITGLTGKRL